MTETTEVTQPLPGRLTLFASGLPIALAVYLLGLSVYLSSRRIMWLDEFFAWGVLTDPSLAHAMHAWLEGADSGGALYYILGHTLLAITGPSVLVARLFGAVLLATAFVVWVRVLRRVFGDRIALIASGVLLVSTGYINYLAEVRFYSQLIAAVVLAVWLALWGQREARSSRAMFVAFFLVHGALVSSHLLGIVYSALVLLGMLLCSTPKRYAAAGLGTLASWILLLFARQPIHVGGLRVAGMRLASPRWTDLFNVYRSEPTAITAVNLVLYLLLIGTALLWLRRKDGNWPLQDNPRSLLFRIALLLGAVPALFFAESWVAPWPLWVVRYMLPGILGISGLTGFMLEYQTRQAWMHQMSRAQKNSIFAVVLLVMVGLHVDAIRHQILRPVFTDAELKPMEQRLPVVVADEQLFFQLKFYESNAVPQFYYVHIPVTTVAGEKSDLMRTIERQGYWGGSLRTRDELLSTVSDFLLLEYSQRDADLIAQLQREGWMITSLGVQNFEGKQTRILRLTRQNT